jgi:hypothetical protein
MDADELLASMRWHGCTMFSTPDEADGIVAALALSSRIADLCHERGVPFSDPDYGPELDADATDVETRLRKWLAAPSRKARVAVASSTGGSTGSAGSPSSAAPSTTAAQRRATRRGDPDGAAALYPGGALPAPGYVAPQDVAWERLLANDGDGLVNDEALISPFTCRTFVNAASSSEPQQGRLGDCWLLGALSLLATRDDLLRRVFVRGATRETRAKAAAGGVHVCRFRKVCIGRARGGGGKECERATRQAQIQAHTQTQIQRERERERERDTYRHRHRDEASPSPRRHHQHRASSPPSYAPSDHSQSYSSPLPPL